MSKIRFEVLPPLAGSEEPVVLVGNTPELGGWNPALGLRLAQGTGPWWVGEIEANEGAVLEYKITRGSWPTEAVDAWGRTLPNYHHQVGPEDTPLRVVVADWKDRYAGRLVRDRIFSHALGAARDVLIWLPPSAAAQQNRRYPVIYFQEGESVFVPPSSSENPVDWGADEWARLLAAEGSLPECLLVAVCHPQETSPEHYSWRETDLSPELGGKNYAEFVVRELVGYVDARYPTLAQSSARALVGASLGALQTFYTALHHPGVFSKYACLSTAFEDVSASLPKDAAQLQALENMPALPPDVRMYFDYGTVGLDECYEPYHRLLDSLLHGKGWKTGEQFVVRRIQGGSHDAMSWRLRLGDALRFLFA